VHAENEVHGLTVSDESGRLLPIEHVEGAAWTVHGAPVAPDAAARLICVRYALVATQHDVGHGSESYYRPLLQPTFFHIIGNTALVYDSDVPDEIHQSISLHWKGFKEAGWKVASSFSVDQDGLTTTETMGDFRHAVFLAGEIRLLHRDVHGSPLWIALAGTDWGFTDEAFADVAARVVAAQRSFFGDYDWPYFFISVIPVGIYKPGNYTQGGTGLTDSFAIFLTPKTELVSKDDGKGVSWLLSHELFHLWNGHRYRLAEPEALGYWFSEGFTNFFARRLLYRAGLVPVDAFLANLNAEIARYTLSRVRGEPAARIAADFWKDRAVEDLPYQRGDVVAVLVDAEIRATSHGAKSLDDLMKDMLAKRATPPPNVTPEAFLARIGQYTSSAFAERIRKITVDGVFASVDAKLLEPCLHGRLEPMGPYDTGFDEGAARANHVVSGVAAGSNAYKAGLRNGQRIVSWKAYRGEPRLPLEAILGDGGGDGGKDGGATRSVSYLPEGKPVPVVQFRADAKLADACRSIL
jgi:predicted metalloprotease with PDZ domain